ncbi:hypothetical protein QO004_003476 [Rhizobium mesoamericanum]|nr:hypothetical protein [Rhizobium mesoamericanum]
MDSAGQLRLKARHGRHVIAIMQRELENMMYVPAGPFYGFNRDGAAVQEGVI